MRMTLLQRYECAVCERPWDQEKTDDTDVIRALVGAEAYAICPVCRREAPVDHKSKVWRERVDAWIKDHAEPDD